MLFRITNYFNPKVILQIGTSYGVSTTAMLDVDNRTKLFLYPAGNPHEDIYNDIVSAHGQRITRCDSISEAISAYQSSRCGDRPFILVNSLIENEMGSAIDIVTEALAEDGVVILRNLSRLSVMNELWERVNLSLDHGMSFTNGKLAVIVGLGYLPRQNFSLWF